MPADRTTGSSTNGRPGGKPTAAADPAREPPLAAARRALEARRLAEQEASPGRSGPEPRPAVETPVRSDPGPERPSGAGWGAYSAPRRDDPPPAPVPYQQPSYQQPPYQQPGYPAPTSWGAYDQYPPPAPAVEGRPWTIAGFVCGLLAILLAPIVLGPLGIIFGFVGNSKGDRKGLWVGIGSIVTTILGFAIGVAVYSAARGG